MADQNHLPEPTKTTAFIRSDAPFPNETTIWEVYCNEAKVVDTELVDDWKSNLNSLMLFASIFAAILTAFIVESKDLLEQDSTDVIRDILILHMQNLANGTHKPYTPIDFRPSKLDIAVNNLFFASLTLSLGTALAGVLAYQWVTQYDAFTKRVGSSPEERVKERHYRFRGTQIWKMEAIIAALPILLHLAVMLFFIGLVTWIWKMDRTVSAVVITGGGAAIIFYVVTTMLAVFFPLCPFRSPLSHGTYIVCRYIYKLIWKTVPTANRGEGLQPATPLKHVWTNLSKRLAGCFIECTVELRDKKLVAEDKLLKFAGLTWLVPYISITDTAYNRLRLLVQEISKFSGDQVSSPSIERIPWNSIFETLGKNYIEHATLKDLGPSDVADLNAWFRCMHMPEIRKSVASEDPEANEDIAVDTNAVYTIVRNPSSHDNINSLSKRRISYFNVARLITRDPVKLREIWGQITSLQCDICDYLVKEMLPTLGAWGFEETQNQVDNLICLLALRRPITLEEPYKMELAISRDLQYTDYSTITVDRPTPLIYLLKCGNWIGRQRILSHPLIRDVIRALLGAHRVYPNLKLRWTFVSAKEEEARALLAVSPGVQDTFARALEVQPQEYGRDEILYSFNRLLRELGQDREGDAVELLCRDFAFSNCLQKGDSGAIITSKISHPSLHLIAWATFGFDWKEAQHFNFGSPSHGWLAVSQYCLIDHPSTHLPTIWRLRTRFWRDFNIEATERMLYDAFDNLESMKNLASAFKQPSLGIDFGGDYLLAIVHSHCAYPQRWRDRFWRNSDIVELVPILLLTGTGQFDRLPTDVTRYLADLCKDIKTDQIRLQRLLIVLIQADLEWDWNKRFPRNLLSILTVLKNYVLNSGKERSTRYYKRLADSILASRNQFSKEWRYQMKREDFEQQCTEVIEVLLKDYSDASQGANVNAATGADEMEKELRFWTGREYTEDRLAKLIRGESDPIAPEDSASSSGESD